MRRRFGWLNNPYLWILSVVAGLIGVANWPSPPPIVENPGVWEEPQGHESQELTDLLSKEGWMEPSLPGEASHIRRLGGREHGAEQPDAEPHRTG